MPSTDPLRPMLPEAEAHWRLDLTTLDFSFDATALALLGTSPADEGGPTVSFQRFTTTFSGSGNAQNILQAIVRIARSREATAETLRYRLKRLDGEEFDADFTIAGESDATGQMVGAAGLLRPVPPPWGAAQLSISTLLEALALPAGVVRKSGAAGTWLSVNAAWRALAGSEPEAWPWPETLSTALNAEPPAPQHIDTELQLMGSTRAVSLHAAPMGTAEDAWLVVVNDRSAAAATATAWARTDGQLRELQQQLGLTAATLTPDDRLVPGAGAEAWLGTEAIELDRWARHALGSSQRAALLASIGQVRQSGAAQALELELLDAEGRPRVLRCWLSADAEHTLHLWAQDISAQRQQQLAEVEQRSRQEHLHALQRGLRHEPARQPQAVVNALGALLRCSSVHLLHDAGAGWRALASWSVSAEGDEAEAWAGHGALLTELATAPEVYAVKYAALDPKLAGAYTDYLSPAGIPSVAFIPVASTAFGLTGEALLIAEQQGPARDWHPDELQAAELLLAGVHIGALTSAAEAALDAAARATQDAAEARAQMQRELTEVKQHQAEAQAALEVRHAEALAALEAQLSASDRWVGELMAQSGLTRAVAHTARALNAPNTAATAALRTLRQTLQQLWLEPTSEAAPPPAVVQALLSARLEQTTAEAREQAVRALELLRAAEVPDAESLASRVAEWGLVDVLERSPEEVLPWLSEADRLAQVQTLAAAASSLATAEASAAEQLTRIAELDRSLHYTGAESRTEVNLTEALEAALAAYQPMRAQGLRITKTFALDQPIVGHPDQLQAVWHTLLGQAAAALATDPHDPREDPGDMRGEMRVTLVAENDEAVVRVSDDGPAPELSDLDAAFDVGYVRAPGQAPLGMDWCRRVIEAHQGRIHMTHAGGATTVTVRLPLSVHPTAAEAL